MKFLITGITGITGPHLANLLHREGHQVYGLIRRTNGMESDIHDVVSDDVYEPSVTSKSIICIPNLNSSPEPKIKSVLPST